MSEASEFYDKFMMLEEMARITAQRDRLLEACRAIYRENQLCGSNMRLVPQRLIFDMHDAIAACDS